MKQQRAGGRTVLAVDLVHGDDELEGVSIGGVGDRVLEEADGTHNLGDLLALVGDVRGIADDDLALGDLALGFHSNDNTVLNNDFINRLVQHVGTSVDGAQPVESKLNWIFFFFFCKEEAPTWQSPGAALQGRKVGKCKETFPNGQSRWSRAP